MSKSRLIACLTLQGDIVVQSLGFSKYLPIGKPDIAIEFLSKWGIDEIILLDMNATKENRSPNYELVKRCSRKCFVPLTVGGGIRSVDQMKRLIRYGADKISLNTAAIQDPSLISQAAEVLGNQCVVISIDVKKNIDGKYEVFIKSGKQGTGVHPVSWAKRVEELGAGEILLNSIDQDGSKKGYDLELLKLVSCAVHIPVIACGGVGHPRHFFEGLQEGKATAVAAGNYFHYTEHSVIVTKSYLQNYPEISIRLDSYADYKHCLFTDTGRVSKKSEEFLEKLRFEYQPKEVI